MTRDTGVRFHQEVASGVPDVLCDAYRAIAPDPDHWPHLVHRVFGQAGTCSGGSEADVKALEAALLVILGETT